MQTGWQGRFKMTVLIRITSIPHLSSMHLILAKPVSFRKNWEKSFLTLSTATQTRILLSPAVPASRKTCRSTRRRRDVLALEILDVNQVLWERRPSKCKFSIRYCLPWPDQDLVDCQSSFAHILSLHWKRSLILAYTTLESCVNLFATKCFKRFDSATWNVAQITCNAKRIPISARFFCTIFA